MTVIIFIIILAVLVLVHEFGHFITAKLSGIRVDEFGLGFPPRAIGIKRGETVYSLNWIPFGGFVKIFGEDPNQESISGPDAQRSFVNKPKSIQALVLVAGICFNIIFAWLLISIGFMSGMPVPQDYATNARVSNVHVTVTSVEKNSPADKAGLKPGDFFTNLSSGTTKLQTFSANSVRSFISSHPNQPISVTYMRGQALHSITITPALDPISKRAIFGITLDVLGTLKLAPLQALWEGGRLTVVIVKETAIGLYMFITQAVTGRAHLSEVTGPIGIAGLVGDASRLGFVYLLSFTAFISINLAVINLIPFPALDGGRLLFVLIEKIKGSPIKPAVANTFNTIGFALLLLLMLVVTFHDILNLFKH